MKGFSHTVRIVLSWLFVLMFACFLRLCLYACACLFVCLSVYLLVCLPVSVYLSVCVILLPANWLTVYRFFNVFLLVYLVYLSVVLTLNIQLMDVCAFILRRPINLIARHLPVCLSTIFLSRTCLPACMSSTFLSANCLPVCLSSTFLSAICIPVC